MKKSQKVLKRTSLIIAMLVTPTLALATIEIPVKHKWFTIELWHEFVAKVDQLRNADQNLEALKTRLAQAESELAEMRNTAKECRELKHSEFVRAESVRDGGRPFSRTIASIQSSKDKAEDLSAESLQAIFERARMSFESKKWQAAASDLLTVAKKLPTEEQTPELYYLLGVSLYELSTYKAAAQHLDTAVKLAESNKDEKTRKYAPRSLSWQVLAYSKISDEKMKMKSLQKLVREYPNSPEAKRMNH